MLLFERRFVWYLNSETFRKVDHMPGMFRNVVMKKDGNNQL